MGSECIPLLKLTWESIDEDDHGRYALISFIPKADA